MNSTRRTAGASSRISKGVVQQSPPRLADQLDKLIAGFQVSADIVDVITFAESPEYLNKRLWPVQREILGKFFNEGMSYEELILICGRRSSKTFITSIIAAYLCYLWIETPDPYYLYQGIVNRGENVCFLCVASDQSQAKVLLGKIRNNIENSPYMRDKIIKSNTDEIELPKNISITAIPSSSSTQVGKTALALFFDEIGRYDIQKGHRDGKEVYNALTPSVSQFVATRGMLLEKYAGDRNMCRVIRFIGKTISFSSPLAESGILWELFQSAPQFPDTKLLFRYATWEMNPNYPAGCQFLENKRREDPTMFDCEYGAQFLKGGTNTIFKIEDIMACVSPMAKPLDPGKEYIAVIDTSRASDAYAFAIGHLLGNKVIVDVLQYFLPVDRKINWQTVTNLIRMTCMRYRAERLFHDQYEAEAVKIYFQGFTTIETAFTQPFKMDIYSNLRNRMINREIEYPGDPRFIAEMQALQWKWNGDKFTVHHPDSGPVTNDDGPDVVANLAYQLYNPYVVTGEAADQLKEASGNSREWPNDYQNLSNSQVYDTTIGPWSGVSTIYPGHDHTEQQEG